MDIDDINRLNLLHSLFKARKDVFAIHWQKEDKSGYMPAYFYDPYLYRLHKLKGGTFNTYTDKTYLPLSDQQILKHIHGEQLIGIYPLLQDNTTCFIAADFDKHEWHTECLAFILNCKKNGIPAYLERSRSGKGGHVWIFIEKSYPAIKIRKIISTLLEQSGIFSVFDKNSSFDRLFPNQDFHSGKGLGNLIAMPLYKPAVELGNSCFLDTKSEALMPYSDQWAFLSAIEKVSCHHLDHLYQTFSDNTNATLSKHSVNDKLQITLSNNIRLNRSSITLELANFLKEELNFSNSEFAQSLYASEDDLLINLLSNKNCKHYKQLRFLASKHDGTAMKPRFFLNPFSFVFLLTGHEQFHLVLETYDTEEATYIWHFEKDTQFEKNTQILKQKLKDIDQDLSVIRNMGRQFFLESNPVNFSRLIHDYADERKGFILWKSLLEERLM